MLHGTSPIDQFIHLMPVFSTILAVLFLKERLQGFHLFGIMLIIIGIFFATNLFRKGATS
jgi:drug/metabolite transporter (DMT)-like permease